MKLKKLMILSLGLAMGISLVSCGDDDAKPTDNTPAETTPTPGTQDDQKVNLTKTYVLEENNSFFGAINVNIKDNLIDAISLMMKDMPIAIKPIYENGTINSVTLLSLADDTFFNLKLTDSLTISGVKITKTTNGIRIGNRAGTIWVEVGNNLVITKSDTVSEKSSVTYDDGSSVTIDNNKLTFINSSDGKIDVKFNGINLDYSYYNNGKVTMSYKSVQDANNPLKLQYIQYYDQNDGNGLLARTKVDFELNNDYTIKSELRGTYDYEVLGIKYSTCTEYVKTNSGYDMNMYYVISGKKALYVTATCECLPNTNVPTKTTVKMNNAVMSEQTMEYDANMNLTKSVRESGNNYTEYSYTYDTNGNRKTSTRIEKYFTYDSSSNKVVDHGSKNEITYDEYDNEIKNIGYDYDKTAGDFVKSYENTTEYYSEKYEKSSVRVNYDANGNVTGGGKDEYTYDDNYNLTKELHQDYNATDERYYKTSERNITHEENKSTYEYIEYEEKESIIHKSKEEITYGETETVTINYSYGSSEYYPTTKEVLKSGTSDSEEITEYYNHNGTDYELVKKEITTYGQNGMDYITITKNINGDTETIVEKDEYRYDINERCTYHKKEELYDETQQLTTRVFEEYAYNENGDYTSYKYMTYYDDGSHMGTSIRTSRYDEQFRIIEEKSYGSEDDTEPNYITTWEYSKEGNNDKIVYTQEDIANGYKQVTTTIKNDNGLVSKKEEYYEKESSRYILTSEHIREYNEFLEIVKDESDDYEYGKQKIIEYAYNDNSKTETTIEFTYDSDGSIKSAKKEVAEKAYVTNMSLTNKCYNYNTTTEKFDLLATEVTYAYDDKGLTSDTTMISYEYNSNNLVSRKLTSKFIDYGFETEIEETYFYDSDNKLTAESRRVRHDFADEDHYYESHWDTTNNCWEQEVQKSYK